MNKKTIFAWALAVIVLVLMILSYVYVGDVESSIDTTQSETDYTVTIPLVDWEIDFRSTGLVAASIFIGLLDGFNPCAMWVLVYLITLVANIQDKKKMWLIVGTFLVTSGILYFIILSLWLQGWELIRFFGYGQWFLYLVGGFALFTGILAVKDFIEKGGQVTCTVGNPDSRKKTMNRIQDIVQSPMTIATFIATVILAFAINSIEFVCSAGLPAMYTQILSVADVTVIEKYFNILLYTLAFMADDLMIFALALMAINSAVMHKYSGLSKILGGVVMIAIGIVLLFFPELLV